MALIPAVVERKTKAHVPWGAKAVTTLVFLILYVPLLTLIVYSFFDPVTGEWSSRWYVEALYDESLRKAVTMSMIVGFWCTLGATLLGTTAALALERTQFVGKKVLDALTLVPLVVPEIVFGLSLLIWFVALRLSLGTISIVLAHITFSFSYVIITVRTRLHDFDMSLEEAARDLGASSWQTFWKVTFPLIFPAILSGALMAFTLSFDDFLITFFTSGVANDTLPVKLYAMIKFGISPKINALSTLILFATIVLVLLAFRPKRKAKVVEAEAETSQEDSSIRLTA